MTDTNALPIETDAAIAITLPKSKVKAAYKQRYAEREAAMVRRPKGLSRKALARCNGDWLAIELARLCLDHEDPKAPFDLPTFRRVLEANGIDWHRWEHLNNGQQRMCGGLALRAVVAEAEELLMPESDAEGTLLQGSLIPTRAWLAKHAR